MRSIAMAVLVLVPLVGTADGETSPSLSTADRVRIAEAFRLADAIGNKVLPEWDKAPFGVLLVTPEYEFLIRHPKPSDDFTLIGDDSVLKEKVGYRKRKFNPEFLATFPAVGGIPTIVIGQPENTAAKTSTHWVITLLHEHFHQLQYSQPRYYAEVDALGLARGDQTGMWMLNFPFPYTTPAVKEQFAATCQALAKALRARQQLGFPQMVESYLEAKKKFRSLLKDDEYKYFAFQAWQEGIARYTEYRLAEMAANEYMPSKQFQDLKDYHSFQDEARNVLAGIEKELTTLQLDKAKRTVFYAFGAAEGLVLDAARPDWRKRYFAEPFSLDKHFQR